MLTITEHLWQNNIPQIQIVNTIIKSKYSKIQFYFFSKNQNKVLRKKNTTLESVMKQVEERAHHKFLPFIIFKYISNTVIVDLISLTDIFQSLSQQKNDIVIICLSHLQERIRIIKVEYVKGEQCKMTPVSFIKQAKTTILQKQQIQKINENILKLCLLFLKSNKNLQVKRLNCFINYSPESIKFIWAQKIEFITQYPKQISFFSFSYQLKQQQQQIKNDDYMLIQQSKKIQSDKEERNQSEQIKCFGCDQNNKIVKQLHIDELIILRESNKLSLKTLKDEYYPVCKQCYQSI